MAQKHKDIPVDDSQNHRPFEDRSVSMSNSLTRGAHGLSLSQKRIIAMALSCTNSSTPLGSTIAQNAGGWRIRINAQDYCHVFDVNKNTAYEQLKDATQRLLKTTWKKVEPRNGKKAEIIREGAWLIFAEYCEGEGYVDLVFSPAIAPDLLSLSKHFTTYKLQQAACLRSVYAWRLFECLKSWDSTGEWHPTIEEFLKAMDAPASAYKDFGTVKRRILEPAIKELLEKNGILVDYQLQKMGRKVTALKISFKQNPQAPQQTPQTQLPLH